MSLKSMAGGPTTPQRRPADRVAGGRPLDYDRPGPPPGRTPAPPESRPHEPDDACPRPLALLALWLAPAFPAAAADPLPVKTVSYEAPSVGRTLKYNLILPAGYEAGSDRYPVLYLLHGLTGNYTNWAKMQVPKYARRHDMIVVMADGGNSWYVNWARPTPTARTPGTTPSSRT